MTFCQWRDRSARLSNALLGLGLEKGDRVCVLAFNCLEWVEIYAAMAFSGLVMVPVNFRLVGPEIQYIVENCEARAIIVQDELTSVLETVRGGISIPEANFIAFGKQKRAGNYRDYEELLSDARDTIPDVHVDVTDPWAFMYTSGTTGKPKGAIRSHRASAMISLVTQSELSVRSDDSALLVMPMCHANSLYFFGAFQGCGARVTVYNRKSIDPEELVRTLSENGSTFTSLVPTHYIMMLGLPPAVRARYNVEAVTKMMISSAPARADTKREIMEYFRNTGLFELYGSTECGWVTMLHPEEQFSKLGSVGRETVGSQRIKILDPDGNEVKDGEAGELYSCNAQTFDGYWKLPEKTREAFRGDYCTVGDLARRDEDGFIHLVDRKSNMVISGGENVYPSEVEAMLGSHPKIKDVAVIGVADPKWGERVHAVIIAHDGAALTEAEIIEWSRDKIAGYKRPRSVSVIAESEMPRTATGKIQHRILRERLSGKI
ncbi:MAG: AMP-binding protein [Xanthobacteraceae bacterium]|nr:AMP-binding protein [Xanthobacteraceae bacterium]